MTASSADTAELPIAGPGTVGIPVRPGSQERSLELVPSPAVTVVTPAPAVTGLRRVDLRAERVQTRRVQRRWALGSVCVLASAAGATVAVLVVLH